MGCLLAACTAADPLPTAAPLSPINVQLSPALSHWDRPLNHCMEGLPGSGLVLDLVPAEEMDYTSADLFLLLGAAPEQASFVSSPGYETLVVAANPDVPLEMLTLEQLRAILRGEISDWQQITAGGELEHSPITVVSLGQEHDLTRWIQADILAGEPLRGDVLTVYSTTSLFKTVAVTPGSIGLAQGPDVPPASRFLTVTDAVGKPILFEIPVSAVTDGEPQGDLRELLTCLQSYWTD